MSRALVVARLLCQPTADLFWTTARSTKATALIIQMGHLVHPYGARVAGCGSADA
jgi:hypothetical protein